MIQRFADVDKAFELSDKKHSTSRTELLYDPDINSEKKFMLEEEPAISEDDGSEYDYKSLASGKTVIVSYFS